MRSQPEDPEIRNGQEIDQGEPIAILAQLERGTSSELIGRIRRDVQRRTTVGHLTSFATTLPLIVLKEFWLVFNEQLGPVEPRKDIDYGEETY
jgi:hypothetical protein